MGGKFTLFYPVKPFHVNQPYGVNGAYYQAHGINIAGHNGIDLQATHGQPVYAAHDGTAYYEIDENQGHGVLIRTTEKFDYGTDQAFYKSIYWHLCSPTTLPLHEDRTLDRTHAYRHGSDPCDRQDHPLADLIGLYLPTGARKRGFCGIWTGSQPASLAMSRDPDSYWEDEYYEELGRKELIDETLKNISQDGIKAYLGKYGDAIDARINDSLTQARYLSQQGYPRHAIVAAVTAIELTIRFMLVRPLVQGAFLSEDWAVLLAKRIAKGRTEDDRKMLPHMLKFHGIDLEDLKLSNGLLLWNTIVFDVNPKRDRIVHRGESATPKQGEVALECANMLWGSVVVPIAESLGFKLKEGVAWHKATDSHGINYDPEDPFEAN